MLLTRDHNLCAFQLERRRQPGYQGVMLPPRNDNLGAFQVAWLPGWYVASQE
jgi:hypothetical protein